MSVEIGYDSTLSPRQGTHVKCVDCGNNMIFFKDKNECRSCDSLIKGCDKCSDDGKSCLSCSRGFFSVDDSTGNKICKSCQEFGQNCASCNLSERCTACQSNYLLMFSQCFKKLW
mmetsp:Transcript_14235/g.24213  ORF Transcript_14235/g.24213 Transcript_14235/m.24213 type:complete len:115 (-) Transcript_14235:66-410(-)